MDAYIKILCFFRKRVVLSLIFLFSLAYFLLQFNAFQLIKFVSFFVIVFHFFETNFHSISTLYRIEDSKTTASSRKSFIKEKLR